jgi:hypothetical protein
VSPVAPIGTRLSRANWSAMKAEAEMVAGRARSDTPSKTPIPHPSAVSGTAVVSTSPAVTAAGSNSRAGSRTLFDFNNTAAPLPASSTPRRLLDFSAIDDDDDDDDDAVDDEDDNGDGDIVGDESFGGRKVDTRRHQHQTAADLAKSNDAVYDAENDTWALRQARLQLRFLNRAFEQTDAGDMLLLREFKPAPLLFQGPLHVERDDTESGDESVNEFVSLTVLDSGAHVPPILLRSTRDGHVSVLVGMETVEGQWFVSEDRFGTSGEDVLVASDEYARAASIVAPALLCLEHLIFPGGHPVALHPVRGKTDFDVMFARSGGAVYSVRLTFVSAMRDSDALRNSSNSVIAPILSTARLAPGGPECNILGLAPLFDKASGPLAVALTSNFVLEATAPLRWMDDHHDDGLPEKLVATQTCVDQVVDDVPTSLDLRMDRRARRLVRNSVAAEIADTLSDIKALRDVQTWAVGAGSVGCVADALSVTDVLSCVEARVAAYTGSEGDGPSGVGDLLKVLGVLVPKWAEKVEQRAAAAGGGVDVVVRAYESLVSDAVGLSVKLRRAVEMNENLHARVNTIREILDARQSALTPAEKARRDKLKERRRRAAVTRRRLEELSAAVRVISSDAASRPYSGAMMPSGIASMGSRPMSNDGGGQLMRRRSSIGSGGRVISSMGSSEITGVQLQRVKELLAQHSNSIADATERTTKLWQQFSAI